MNGKLLGLFLFASTTLFAQNNSYTLKGNIEDNQYNGKKVYLQKIGIDYNSVIVIDSTTIENNRFTFVKANEDNTPSLRIVSIKDSVDKEVLFITEPGEITVSIGNKNKIGGAPLNERFQDFFLFQDSLKNKINEIVKVYSALDQTSANHAKMEAERQVILKQIQERGFSYAKENINSGLGEFLTMYLSEILTTDQVLELTSVMSPEFKNSRIGKMMISFYEAKKSQENGAPYKDITLTAPLGNSISLSDYVGKNKLVLIDFWASWCGPCIKEMPNVIEAYNLYKDKGFEIVGISLDDNQSKWLGAIDRLGMTWPQMSDLKGWDSEAGKLYRISSIPYTILVDQEGKIVATNLRGTQLISKLGELLD